MEIDNSSDILAVFPTEVDKCQIDCTKTQSWALIDYKVADLWVTVVVYAGI